MAFTPSTMSGNINSNGNGASVLLYQTPDTIAEVSAANYFSADRSVVAYKIMFARDTIICQCSDGLASLIVISQDVPQISTLIVSQEA